MYPKLRRILVNIRKSIRHIFYLACKSHNGKEPVVDINNIKTILSKRNPHPFIELFSPINKPTTVDDNYSRKNITRRFTIIKVKIMVGITVIFIRKIRSDFHTTIRKILQNQT